MPTLRLLAEDRMEARAVAVVARAMVGGSAVDALADTQRAFDGVAAVYHRYNIENALLEGMRRRFRDAVERHVTRGSHLLDLGCGPGTDEVWFAARGYRVTAVDWSPSMVSEARERVRRHRIDDRVSVRNLGIHEIDGLAPSVFDGITSNLGPLNCVPDLDGAALAIARRIRPGGVLVASVIGRVCPWEIALYASRRDWSRLRVRFARGLTPVPLERGTVWTRYHTRSAFERTFASAGFDAVEARALGLLAPPPYLQRFAERHPRTVAALQQLDDAVGSWPGLRNFGDHFLVVMRRR